MNTRELVHALRGSIESVRIELGVHPVEPVTWEGLQAALDRVTAAQDAADEQEARAQETRDRLSVVPGVADGATAERNRVGECASCNGPILEWFEWAEGDHPGERDYSCPACGKRTRFYSAAWLDSA